MYKGIEKNKTFSIKEVFTKVNANTTQIYAEKYGKGWQPSATSSFDQNSNKMNT